MNDMLTALRLADPALSRFEPMKRIICFDDFDRGLCGWTQLVGNYEHTLVSMLPGYAQHTQPMLSSLTHWDAGTHGAVDGTYALGPRVYELASIARAIDEDPADLLAGNPARTGLRRVRPRQIGYTPELDHEHLKALRVALNLTMKEAAAKAGMYYIEWCAMERGERSSIKLSTLAKLAVALHVDSRDLLALPPSKPGSKRSRASC